MKKSISLLLALLMLCSALTLASPVYAEDYYRVTSEEHETLPGSGKLNKKISYTFDKKSGTLTIKGKGKMPDYDSQWFIEKNPSPFNYHKEIKTVVIKNGVTGVGDCAFVSCKNLKSVTLPESVKTLGKYSFAYCKRLKSVNLPKGLKTIPEGCFGGCERLPAITLPSSLRTIQVNAFFDCYKLESIKLPKKLKRIESNAFDACMALKEIKIPKNCLVMEYAFSTSGVAYAELAEGTKILPHEAFEQTNLYGGSGMEGLYLPASLEVFWLSGNWAQDYYYGGTKAQFKKVDVLYNASEEGGETHNVFPDIFKLRRVYCNIAPSMKIPSLHKPKAAKKAATVSWDKVKGAKGYEVEYTSDYYEFFEGPTPQFENGKTKRVSGTSIKLKKLKSGKKYFFRVRCYKTVNGKKKYSRWSAWKSVKVK